MPRLAVRAGGVAGSTYSASLGGEGGGDEGVVEDVLEFGWLVMFGRTVEVGDE